MSPAIWRQVAGLSTPPHASGAETAGRHGLGLRAPGSRPWAAIKTAIARTVTPRISQLQAAGTAVDEPGFEQRMELPDHDGGVGPARLPRAITRDSGAKVTFFCTEQRYPTSYLRMGAISGGAALPGIPNAEAAARYSRPLRTARPGRGVACPLTLGALGPTRPSSEAATRIAPT